MRNGTAAMKLKSSVFRVREGDTVDLTAWSTLVDRLYDSKADYEDRLAAQVEDLSRHQVLLYADNSRALLLIFQAMDAAGKDGAIRHVMSGVNPQGCQVFSFQHPSATELEHDFLWRTTRNLPERGRIGIFNRSYYEEVLVVRVHPALLRAQGLPDATRHNGAIWTERFRSITDLERHLDGCGTKIVKFFLHLSKEEQRQRFIDRIDEPDKNWKFGAADLTERGFWNEYMHAYGECLSATSTKNSPWYIVPADDKQNARLIISEIILDTFEDLDLEPPTVDAKRVAELHEYREQLINEGSSSGASDADLE